MVSSGSNAREGDEEWGGRDEVDTIFMTRHSNINSSDDPKIARALVNVYPSSSLLVLFLLFLAEDLAKAPANGLSSECFLEKT
jgi:hypothetical protein